MVDYGTDLSDVTDLTEDMAEVSGRLCMIQALARRIQTPRGTLIDDPNYGIDITDYLDADIADSSLSQVAGLVDAEFLKDERVIGSTTSVTSKNSVLTIQSQLQDGAGPFKLVLSVDQVTIAILKVTPL